jgi:hypothetical protein
MRPGSKLIFAVIAALAVLMVSLFVQIIPCQTAPQIPNPQYKWGMCTQNPDYSPVLDVKYFAYTSSLSESYIITLVLSFVLVFLILSVFFRRKRE